MFANAMEKTDFYTKLKDFVVEHGLGVQTPKSMSAKHLKADAQTKLVRQELLDKFFRAVFARVGDVHRKIRQNTVWVYKG